MASPSFNPEPSETTTTPRTTHEEETPQVMAPQQAVQGGAEMEEEEEGECGFCLFMKGGGCKEAFVAWEECVEAAEKDDSDMVERCFQATANLKKCMDAHADYYAPILQAEQAVSDHADQALSASTSTSNKEEVEAVTEKAASTSSTN